MKQFDVCANPVMRARGAFPWVVILQADIAETGRDRIVAFLAPVKGLKEAAGRLLPAVTVCGAPHAVLLPSLTTLPLSELKEAVDSVHASRDAIVKGLDWLFLGV